MKRTATLPTVLTCSLVLLIVPGLVGCAGSGAHPPAVGSSAAVAAGSHDMSGSSVGQAAIQATPQLRFLGASREGRPIECLDLGTGRETVLFLATIHGNESAGTPLMEALYAHLVAHPELIADRRVLIVPCLNPDGYATSHRHNARGVDLNRNFPALNWRTMRTSGDAPASEPEAEILLVLIDRTTPDRIITFHQPLACIDYDGPSEDLARAMAAACDLPVRKLGTRNGSLGAYAGETLGIPIITVEFGRDAHRFSKEEMWTRYRAMLEVAVRGVSE